MKCILTIADLFQHYDLFASFEGRLPYYDGVPHGIEENDIIARKDAREFYKLGTYTSLMDYPTDPDYHKSDLKYVNNWTYRPENSDGIYLIDLRGLAKDATELRDNAVQYFEGCITLEGKTSNDLEYTALITAPDYWDDLGAYNTTMYAYIICSKGCVYIAISAKADTETETFGPELFIRYLDEVAAGIHPD